MSSKNKNYAEAMSWLEEEDPTYYEAIQKKVRSLKSEAMTWRLQAQGKTSTEEISK